MTEFTLRFPFKPKVREVQIPLFKEFVSLTRARMEVQEFSEIYSVENELRELGWKINKNRFSRTAIIQRDSLTISLKFDDSGLTLEVFGGDVLLVKEHADDSFPVSFEGGSLRVINEYENDIPKGTFRVTNEKKKFARQVIRYDDGRKGTIVHLTYAHKFAGDIREANIVRIVEFLWTP